MARDRERELQGYIRMGFAGWRRLAKSGQITFVHTLSFSGPQRRNVGLFHAALYVPLSRIAREGQSRRAKIERPDTQLSSGAVHRPQRNMSSPLLVTIIVATRLPVRVLID
jgi:hypothetical protein